MDVFDKDGWTIATPRQYLDDYPLLNEPYREFTAKEQHLNPKILLKAALEYAPSGLGRVNVAKFIVNADEDTSHKLRNARLEELARHVFINLLVPCITHYLSSLTVVQVKGGSTRQVSERSTPPSGYELNSDEFQRVKRRTGNRKMVLPLWAELIDITDLAAIRLHLPNDKYQRSQLSGPHSRRAITHS